MWNLDGTGPAAAGRDEQTGWYLEPSYRVTNKTGVFARYNEWDNAGTSPDTKNKPTWASISGHMKMSYSSLT